MQTKTKQQAKQEQRLQQNVKQAKSDKAELRSMPDSAKKDSAKSLKARLFGRADTPHTAQQTLPFREIYRDGVCRVNDRLYTKTIAFADINYQLAQNEDKTQIFENYCDFLNCATRSHTNAIPLTKNLWAQDHVALKMGGFQYCVEATTDILKSGMMG